MEFEQIEWEEKAKVVTLWLNRPEKRNAFDNGMISEIRRAIQKVNEMADDTVLILRGRGSAFCAGADLFWMQEASRLDEASNYQECLNLSQCLFDLYSCNKVTIAAVHGAAYGGGIGLAAACDLAFCTHDTKFALSELRVGLVASCISPYVYKKLGESRLKELVFTARPFDGKQAETYGLVNRSVPSEKLEQVIDEYTSFLFQGTPKARGISKKLILQVAQGSISPLNVDQTAKILADIRIADEAKQRIGVFLNKS